MSHPKPTSPAPDSALRRLNDALELSQLSGPIAFLGDPRIAEIRPAIAVVGSREAGSESLDAIAQLTTHLVRLGAPIVSGGARGTDTAAHQAALRAGAPTIACLPGGLDWFIRESRHPALPTGQPFGTALLVSCFPPEVAPNRSRPVLRNRLIAALADVVVVGEAGLASGTWHCVKAALDYRRPVFFLTCDDKTWDPRLDSLHKYLTRRGARPLNLDQMVDPATAHLILSAKPAADPLRQDHIAPDFFENPGESAS